MKEQIEQKEGSQGLVFTGEVKSLEFTENIGDKENSMIPKERDMELKNIGKKLFKKHPSEMDRLFRIKTRKIVNTLLKEEVLLTPDGEKQIITRYCSTWELSIYIKRKSFKITLPFRKYDTETEKLFPRW